jgi:hypothetical protein
MRVTMRVVAILCLACLVAAPSFAGGNWSGYLVNSSCYADEESNVNPTDTLTYVDRDKDLEIRLCAPNAKTKSFALVQSDGTWFKLDAAGNTKATELVQKTGKIKNHFLVVVAGEMTKNTLQVTSISARND